MDEKFDILKAAREVFDIEIDALERTRDSLGNDFLKMAELIIRCQGKVILTGMGKPGHIATKIAATLASLGTPSFYIHPGEALHGDLGMVESKDVVFLMSYSGESSEVVDTMPVLKEIGCTTVAITGNLKSTLAREADCNFVFPAFKEACYLQLAPTSSTTALLVVGDALAVVLSKLRNYTKDDFGLHHPAGSLGKKLLTKVSDLMYAGDKNATVSDNTSLHKAIIEMSGKGLSMVTVVDESGKLRGILTDGDLRRLLERSVDVYNVTISEVMTPDPKWIDYREKAVDALQKMNEYQITGLPVLDEKSRVVGAILLQSVLKAGIV